MKNLRNLRLALLVTLFTGCAGASVESRIDKDRKAFDSYPLEVQNKIKAQTVEVGYTEAMVAMALGKPDKKYTEKTEKGTVYVWAWTESKGGVGFGVGVGMSSRGGVGTGVSVGTGGGSSIEKQRVVFQDGKVVSFSERE